jgi:hypothetical protein
MRHMTIAVATTLALAALATPADARNVISDPAKIVESADAATIAAIVNEMGFAKAEIREDKGEKAVVFTYNEQPYIISVTGCDTGKCESMIPIALVDTSPQTITTEQLVKITDDNIYLAAFKLDGNVVGFGHVVIMEGGVTRQNVAVNIADFIVTYEETLKKLVGNPLTSSLQPSQQQAAAALASMRLRPVMPRADQVHTINARLLQQHRDLFTQGTRH